MEVGENRTAAGAIQTLQFPFGLQVVSLHENVDQGQWDNQECEYRSSSRDNCENEENPSNINKQHVELTRKSFVDTVHVTVICEQLQSFLEQRWAA